jgi:hypothetical protein
LSDTEDDRDRRCGGFGRERSLQTAARGDLGHVSADQVS